MADPKGFLNHGREVAKTRPVEERVKDWNEVYVPGSLLPIISKQAGRCMDCGIPFCHNGCPLGNLIPEWNDYAYREDWTGAPASGCTRPTTSRSSPAACAPRPASRRVCSASTSPPVTIKNVEVSIIDKAWDSGDVTPQPPERLSGKTVAVIGSGPAGLAAAQQLTRAGHTVAVYERADRIGGLLRYGIPEFKMEKRHINRRIEQMRAEGTKFRTGVEIGRDLDADEAAQAVRRGRHRRRCHHLPRPAGPRPRAERHPPGDGVPAAGQQGAGGRLRRSPRSPPRASTSSSSAAATPARTASAPPTARARPPSPSWRSCRSRARSGTPDQPWPTFPMLYKVTSAHEEGGERVYSVSTTHFEGDEDGNVQCAAPRRGGVQGRQARAEAGHRAEDPGPAGHPRHGLHRHRPGERPGRAVRPGARRARQRRPRRATSPPTSPASSSPVTRAAASR